MAKEINLNTGEITLIGQDTWPPPDYMADQIVSAVLVPALNFTDEDIDYEIIKYFAGPDPKTALACIIDIRTMFPPAAERIPLMVWRLLDSQKIRPVGSTGKQLLYSSK